MSQCPRDARSIGDVASGREGQPERRAQQSGIVVARLFGIPVYVSPYWFVIAGVFIVIYANDLGSSLHGGTRYAVAAAFVVLLYLSVLVHELSHSVVARGYGLPVRRILLYPLGGVSEIDKEPQTPSREFVVSAAGPALSLALGAAGWGLTKVITDGISGSLVRQLMVANIIVGLFNLLPGLPLDGGRMLRAVLWKLTGKPATATIAAAWVGRAIAIGLLAIPFYSGSLAGGDMVSTLWVVVIAAFMWVGAGQSIRADPHERGDHRHPHRADHVPAGQPAGVERDHQQRDRERSPHPGGGDRGGGRALCELPHNGPEHAAAVQRQARQEVEYPHDDVGPH